MSAGVKFAQEVSEAQDPQCDVSGSKARFGLVMPKVKVLRVPFVRCKLRSLWSSMTGMFALFHGTMLALLKLLIEDILRENILYGQITVFQVPKVK
jgi:hypothetical protein